MNHSFEARKVRRLSLEPARFISAREQRKLSRTLERVPVGTCCPNCRHSYDIVISRQQLSKGRLSRCLFRYFRCRVCEHRFTQFKPVAVHRVTGLALATVVFVLSVMVPNWLG